MVQKMITVIIPTFNRPLLLMEALRSLSLQTFKHFDVIIINDGGSDISNYTDKWIKNLNIQVINLPTNTGVSNARNKALEHARGKYVAFLDDDDVFLPNHLEVAIKTLQDENIDFTYSGALVNKERTDILNVKHSTPYKKTYLYSSGYLHIANYIHTGAIVTKNFRNSEVRFDSNFKYCEDWDLWFSLYKKLGYKFKYTNQTTCIYHLQAEKKGMLNEAQKVSPTPFTIARQQFYKKWPSENKKINKFRKWFSEFEKYRDNLIVNGEIISPYLFDKILGITYSKFINNEEISSEIIPSFFKTNKEVK